MSAQKREIYPRKRDIEPYLQTTAMAEINVAHIHWKGLGGVVEEPAPAVEEPVPSPAPAVAEPAASPSASPVPGEFCL